MGKAFAADNDQVLAKRERWFRSAVIAGRTIVFIAMVLMIGWVVYLVCERFVAGLLRPAEIPTENQSNSFDRPYGAKLTDFPLVYLVCASLAVLLGFLVLSIRGGSIARNHVLHIDPDSPDTIGMFGRPIPMKSRAFQVRTVVNGEEIKPDDTAMSQPEHRAAFSRFVSNFMKLNGAKGLVPEGRLLFLSTLEPMSIRDDQVVDGRSWDGETDERLVFEMPGDMKYDEMCPALVAEDPDLHRALRDAREWSLRNRYAFAWNQRQWRLEWEHRFYLIQSIFDTIDSEAYKSEYVFRSEQYHSAGVAREAIPIAAGASTFVWLLTHIGQLSQHGRSSIVALVFVALATAMGWYVIHNVRRIYWYALVKLMYNDISYEFSKAPRSASLPSASSSATL
jgi:hypothetical protein